MIPTASEKDNLSTADGGRRFLSMEEIKNLVTDTKIVIDPKLETHWVDKATEAEIIVTGTDLASVERRVLAQMGHVMALVTSPPGLGKTHAIEAALSAQLGRVIELKGHLYADFNEYRFPDWFLPVPEELTSDEQHGRDKRRKQARLNHKDRRDESRDAKAAMIERAMQKMKAKKRG